MQTTSKIHWPGSDSQINSMEITRIYINGNEAASNELSEAVTAFSDLDLLTEKGGFLFRSLYQDNELHLGIIPCILDGKKTFHHEARLDVESEFTLIGWIAAPSGEFSILFRPARKHLTPDMKRKYVQNYIAFSKCVMESGYVGHGWLTPVTREVLTSLDIAGKTPETLRELSALPDCF